MDRQAIISQVSEIIGDFLKNQEFQLVDIIYRYEGRDLFLRILVDRPYSGINMEECVRLNRQISEILDGKNILERRYILEVSSPGLDRPLKNKADFMRYLGRQARFFLKEPVLGKIEIEGLIESVTENNMIEVQAKDAIIQIPLEKVNKAKQIIGRI